MSIQKYILQLLFLVVFALLMCNVFGLSPSLFNGTVTAKQWHTELFALCALPVLLLLLLFKNRFSLTAIDLLVGVFIGWSVVNQWLVQTNQFVGLSHALYPFVLWGAIYLLVRNAPNGMATAGTVPGVWLGVVAVQGGISLLQLYGVIPSLHGLFKITGTFHNPGPFSGYVVAGLPMAVGVVLAFRACRAPVCQYNNFQALGKRWTYPANGRSLLYVVVYALALIAIVVSLLVVPAARSRAAWLAALSGLAYVAWTHPAVAKNRLKAWGSFNRWSLSIRAIALLGGLAFIVAIGYGLYTYKAGSANGRWLMWQVTSSIIAQKPIVGHGAGAFGARYMPAQAEWFSSGNGTTAQALVAGSPEAPFNELLKLWLHYGLVAVAIAGAILFCVFKTIKKQTQQTILPDKNHYLHRGLKGSLLALLVFGMFSYPFDLAPHVLLLVVVTALLAGHGKVLYAITHKYALAGIKTGTVVLLILVAVVFVPKRVAYYSALKIWQEAAQTYNMQFYSDASELYANAMPELGNNGLFLQMYGKALSMAGQHAQSNEVLAKANKRYGSYIIYNTMGDNHKALGNFSKAEMAYQTAGAMVPDMMLAKYLLAKLYHDTGQQAKAIETANNVLNMPIKVQSMATDEIKNEMKKIINYKQ